MLTEEMKSILEVQRDAFKEAVKMMVDSLNQRIYNLERKDFNLEARCTALEESLNFSDKNIADLKNLCEAQQREIKYLKDHNDLYENNMKTVTKRVDYQEDYSRRNNLRIDGVGESPREKWEVTEEKVRRILKDNLQMENVQLERVHRVGPTTPPYPTGPLPRPRTIIAKFSHFADREMALRKARFLKNTNVYLNEDLCEASQAIRR